MRAVRVVVLLLLRGSPENAQRRLSRSRNMHNSFIIQHDSTCTINIDSLANLPICRRGEERGGAACGMAVAAWRLAILPRVPTREAERAEHMRLSPCQNQYRQSVYFMVHSHRVAAAACCC